MTIPGVIQTGQVPGVKMGPMGIRAAAGARAVGAPKAAPKGVTKGAKVRTPPAKTAAPTKATPVKAAGFNYGNMTPAEATRYITGQVGAETKANLAPLKARQNEIGQTEGAVQNRYAGYGQATQGILQGLQGTAEQGAKTFQNNVAEEALRASKGVETAGQNALTASAGYVSPELRGALGNQMGNIAATGTAANQAAGAMGANEQNFLTNIRAAAAQRVTEGQRGIVGVYGKQRGEVQGKEQALLARQPGAIMKGVQGILGEQSKLRTNREGLGLKEFTARNKALTEGTTRERNQAAVAKSTAEIPLKQASTKADVWQKEADARYKEAHAAATTEKSTKPKTPSPASGRKYMKELDTAVQLANLHLGARKFDHAWQEEVRKYMSSIKGMTPDIVSAGMNLAVYGVLGPQDRVTAASYGLTPAIRGQWFTEPAKNPAAGVTGGVAAGKTRRK